MSQSRYAPGIHAADRLLTKSPERIRRLLIDERSENPRLQAAVKVAEEKAIPVEMVRRYRLDALVDGARHQGIVVDLAGADVIDEAGLRTLVETRLAADQDVLLLYLDRIQDPHNLGACFRSADAAGVHAVIVPRRDAAGLTPVTRKIASGAAESVPLVRVESAEKLLAWVADYGIRIIGTSDQGATSLFEAEFSGPQLLIMGSEERGVHPRLLARSDQVVAIPMAGEVESLNVSVATGVVLFEIARQRSLAGVVKLATGAKD